MPMICRAGAVYDSNRFKCPSSILIGKPKLGKTCRVKITKTAKVETQISELIPGTFIILFMAVLLFSFASANHNAVFNCISLHKPNEKTLQNIGEPQSTILY